MVTSQNTMSHIQYVTDILFIFAKQNIFMEYSLLKQLYKIGPRFN